MTRREATGLVVMTIVIIFGIIVAMDMVDPTRKYRSDAYYCKLDTDCAIVYDLLSGRCFSVNSLHKDKYDNDVICRKRVTKCLSHKCIAP